MGARKLLILLGIAVLLAGCEDNTTPSVEQKLTPDFIRAHDDPATMDFYQNRVQPIFKQDCNRCHAGLKHEGGLNLQGRSMLLKGGKHGPALIPGDVASSLLIKGIRREDQEHVKPMPPPPQEKLPDADIAVIERWVKAGAMMPNTASGR